MPELAYLNGDIGPIDNALVPIEDRGYNFGDAVYEYIASYNGRLFCLEEHLARLRRSLTALAFPEIPIDTVREAVETLFEKAAIPRAGIYLQISRGTAPRDHAFPKSAAPQFMMTIRPVAEKPPSLRRDGAAAITVADVRWGRCDIKTVQLLPNVMAKQQALDAGAFDAIFVSDSGIVREATSSNLFIAKNGRLATHPLTERILAGITREVLLAIAAEHGMAVDEDRFTREDLYAADEVFLSGTVTEVLPIVTVDGRPIGSGTVGPMTRNLYEALKERIGA